MSIEQLVPGGEPPADHICDIIAAAFARDNVVPFLGAGASVNPADEHTLPLGSQFAERLASSGRYPFSERRPIDALTKIAQWYEEVTFGRHDLLDEVRSTFFEAVPSEYSTPWVAFLGAFLVVASAGEQKLPRHFPRLIITTNYDDLVERTLDRHGVPYVVLAHVRAGSAKAGQMLYRDSRGAGVDVKTSIEVDAELKNAGFLESAPGMCVIYKMHGTIPVEYEDELLDSIVLTETDYIDFIADGVLDAIPSLITRHLRKSHFLFLGYSLQDWNFRVFLRRLQKRNLSGSKHWAILQNPDEVEKTFFDKRSVTVREYDLAEFLPKLLEAIRRQP